MILERVGEGYKVKARGDSRPDTFIVRGKARWDVYEISGDDHVLVASDLRFLEARAWGIDNLYVAPPQIPTKGRTTRKGDGLHEYGPVWLEKALDGWRVFSVYAEYGHSMQFMAAKRLAGIEEKKLGLALFKLAMAYVPHSIRSINLHHKLVPSQWRKLSKECYTRAGGVCEICGTAHPRLDCHEDWECDDLRMVQRLKQLMSICFLCHRAIHYNASYLWTDEAHFNVIDHFKAVNQCDGVEMSRHREAAEWIYEKRLDQGWAVDFGEYADLVAKHPHVIKTRKQER